MVALQGLPILTRNSPLEQRDEQRHTNRILATEVLWWLLQPVTFITNRHAGSGYYNILCADGTSSCYKLQLIVWLSDYPEYSDLHHLKRHVTF
jgi:hypothetical protein